MDTLGSYSEYMSSANDFTSCAEVEGESVYYSMNETIRNCSEQDSSQEGNVTLKDDGAIKIGDKILHSEELPVSELEINHNENLISSTPNKFNISTVNNKSVDGFLEMSKILRQITTKLQAVQNKENIDMNKNENISEMATTKSPGVKLMKTKVITSKSAVIITAAEVRNVSNDKTIKKSAQLFPTSGIQNKMSMRTGPTYAAQNMRKSFIPSKLEIKEKSKESPNKKLLPTQGAVRKECTLRKSIMPKYASNRQVTSALKVSTKPRPSIYNSQKTLNPPRSLEKLTVAANQKATILETKSSISTSGKKRKTLNLRRSIGKLNVAFNQETTGSESKPSTTGNGNTLNLRRSIARFQGINNKETAVFDCTKCNRKFRMESNYLTHMNDHIGLATLNLVCKYCDKKFQLGGALQTHLRDYCTKIPPKEKRLLTVTKSQMTPASKNNSKTNSLDSLSKISNYSPNSVRSDASLMKAPGLPFDVLFKEMDKKLKTFHSGVPRTPKKINMCKKCGKMFYNIFALQAHTTCAVSDDADDDVETDGNAQN